MALRNVFQNNLQNTFQHVPLHEHEENKIKRHRSELTEDELLITSPVLWGFSLADKLWCA
jgi:hypothetical protein